LNPKDPDGLSYLPPTNNLRNAWDGELLNMRIKSCDKNRV